MAHYYQHSDLFPYRPIDPIWIIVYTLPSFIFFIIIQNYTTKYGIKQIRIKKNKIDETVLINEKLEHSSFKTQRQIKWIYQNTFLSFIHSTICGLLLFISVYQASEIFKDPLSHTNEFNYTLLCFSLGYFFYDMYDCLLYSPKNYPIIAHHIAVIIYILHSLIYTRNIGYTIFALSMEINSIFLHARRLLNWSTIFNKQYQLIFIIKSLNYLTFLIFRFGNLINAMYNLYIQRHRLTRNYLVFNITAVLFMGMLNIILFYRLIQSDLDIQKQKKRKD
ncbi:unnamed protein product [Didymodactylos carnosus]|uniref:TLC domain-containing protein n=1 Tax=Didymodactylos carnosus TaxID=1234261 RepID=A0A815GL73_9BILA|nr:unnamed protein product [Didymodactylos carnosus]CAF4200250.1 unnamed protein product [Didymodactylos carnosus]